MSYARGRAAMALSEGLGNLARIMGDVRRDRAYEERLAAQDDNTRMSQDIRLAELGGGRGPRPQIVPGAIAPPPPSPLTMPSRERLAPGGTPMTERALVPPPGDPIVTKDRFDPRYTPVGEDAYIMRPSVMQDREARRTSDAERVEREGRIEEAGPALDRIMKGVGTGADYALAAELGIPGVSGLAPEPNEPNYSPVRVDNQGRPFVIDLDTGEARITPGVTERIPGGGGSDTTGRGTYGQLYDDLYQSHTQPRWDEERQATVREWDPGWSTERAMAEAEARARGETPPPPPPGGAVGPMSSAMDPGRLGSLGSSPRTFSEAVDSVPPPPAPGTAPGSGLRWPAVPRGRTRGSEIPPPPSRQGLAAPAQQATTPPADTLPPPPETGDINVIMQELQRHPRNEWESILDQVGATEDQIREIMEGL